MPTHAPRQRGASSAPADRTAQSTPAVGSGDNSLAQMFLKAFGLQDQPEESLLDTQSTGRPFEQGASRGDFLWALARDAGKLRGASREQGIAWAVAKGISNGERVDDPVSRAEAATMAVRALGLPHDLPEGEIAYFADVDESAWYFESAHVARRYGLFVGANNRFLGDTPLAPDQAMLVLARAQGAAPRTPEQQSPGLTPLLERDGLVRLLAQDELGYEDIARARDKAAALDPDKQAEAYEQLAGKVSYRNQRDNEGKYARKDARALGSKHGGDVMCNVTSLAMALNQLGLGVDESSAQFEDLLDEMMTEQRLGSRYAQGGQAKTAAKLGADTERVYTPAFRGAASAKSWYEENVLPKLKAGASATLSIAFGARRNDYHIVRLEWVESEGLRIDDPYGALFKKNAGWYSYDKNDVDSSEGEGAKGEDRLWSWQTVSDVNRGRYVQFYTRSDQS